MNRSIFFVLSSLILSSVAFAQSAAPAKPSIFESVIPFVIMFAVIYFLMLRPQSKQRKQHAQFVAELKRGEVVVTAGGIIGKIDNVNDRFVTLEVENGAKMKVIRSYILSPVKTTEETKA